MQDWLDPLYEGNALRTHRREHDRSTARILSAAVVAGGLAFSASLNPLPGFRSPLELWQQEHQAISNLPGHLGTLVAKQLVGLTNVETPTLADLVEILHNRFPAVRAEVFLRILENHSLPEIVRTFGVLMAAGAPLPASTALYADGGFGGGGGGGGGGSASTTSAELTSLFQLLLRHMPAYLARELIAVLYPPSVAPAKVTSVTQSISPPEQILTITSPAVATLDPPPAPVAPPPTDPPPSPPPPPPAAEVGSTPSFVETPPTHTNDTPALDTQLPPPAFVPDVPDRAPVIDEPGVGDDSGVVGGDDTSGSDDQSLGNGNGNANGNGNGDEAGNGDGVGNVGGELGSDDDSGGNGAADDSSGNRGGLNGGDDNSTTSSISRAAASSVGGGAGGSASGGSTGGSDGNDSGDTGSGGD